MRVTFHEVKIHSSKKGVCKVCGKPATRSKVFSQTINPFNKKKNGTIKTEKDIYQELVVEADNWKLDFTHGKCGE